MRTHDVSIVDSLWPLLFLIAAATYGTTVQQPGPHTTLVVVLVGLWAIRLAGYLTWRNWGTPEDRRPETPVPVQQNGAYIKRIQALGEERST